MSFFERLNSGIRNSEASIVNLLSAIAPWLAPLAPAYMTYSHLTKDGFDFPIFVAISVAIVVEVLGLSAISTILAFWSHNKKRVAEYKKAPVSLAVFSFIMYLSVVLIVNVVLDSASLIRFTNAPVLVQITAKALLTLLSIPAAVILAVRTQHKEVLDQIHIEKLEKRAQRREEHRQQVVVDSSRKSSGRVSDSKQAFFKELDNSEHPIDLSNTENIVRAIVDSYNVSERTAFRWLREARGR